MNKILHIHISLYTLNEMCHLACTETAIKIIIITNWNELENTQQLALCFSSNVPNWKIIKPHIHYVSHCSLGAKSKKKQIVWWQESLMSICVWVTAHRGEWSGILTHGQSYAKSLSQSLSQAFIFIIRTETTMRLIYN